jgi:phage internal scaffolding protein
MTTSTSSSLSSSSSIPSTSTSLSTSSSSSISPPFLRSPYNYDRDAVSSSTGLACQDLSLTVQADAKDADINEIVRRFGLTGELPTGVAIPQYGDFLGVYDYQTALNEIKRAESAFMAFPAHVRERFGHDVAEFLDWGLNPENAVEAQSLGINPNPVAGTPASGAASEPQSTVTST